MNALCCLKLCRVALYILLALNVAICSAQSSPDLHMSMEQFAAALNGAATPGIGPGVGEELPTEPVVVPWDEVFGSVVVTTPAEGAIVEGTVIEVAVNINTNTEDINMFTEKYNSSKLCLSLDNSTFSCWPIWELSRYPRFANVSAGEHKLVARITDPVTHELDVEHEGVRLVTMVPKPPKTEKTDEEKATEESEKDTSKNSTNSTEPKQETISLPMVTVDQPSEGIAMPSDFEVRLSITTTEEVEYFKRLFAHSFMCLSMDDGPYTCWPIFEDRYFPTFHGLTPGMHRLTAELSHPESGDIILGTGVGFRRFWVQEQGSGLVPMRLSQPSNEGASTALQEDKDKAENSDSELPVAQVVVKVAIDGLTHSLPIYEGDDREAETLRFCSAYNLGERCVTNVLAEIEALWNNQLEEKLTFSTGEGERDEL